MMNKNGNKISVTTYSLTNPNAAKTQTFDINFPVQTATARFAPPMVPSVSFLPQNNQNLSLLKRSAPQVPPLGADWSEEEKLDAEEEELAIVHTFNDYMPSKRMD